MIALALLACVHREPAPLFAPIRRVDLPQPIEPVARPEDCESSDVLQGEPLTWAPHPQTKTPSQVALAGCSS